MGFFYVITAARNLCLRNFEFIITNQNFLKSEYIVLLACENSNVDVTY